MELAVTLSLAFAAAAVAAFSGWRGSKPWRPLSGPRLLPWRFLMVSFAFVAFLALVHAANLAGFTTGGAR